MNELPEISVLRSKNAGPFVLTFDIVLRTQQAFERVQSILTSDAVARAYSTDPKNVISTGALPAQRAIKISIRRRHPAGHPGDPDCYGMNQEEPLANLLRTESN
jgi:hypothetical protein